jgi:hypothetical protein
MSFACLCLLDTNTQPGVVGSLFDILDLGSMRLHNGTQRGLGRGEGIPVRCFGVGAVQALMDEWFCVEG